LIFPKQKERVEMAESPAVLVIESYCAEHQLILNFTQKLSDEQLYWQLTPDTHSIAFHLWHVARWADHIQAAFPGMTPELGRRLGPGAQIWHEDRTAERWGFRSAELGYAETGMGMTDAYATRLPFPARAELMDYVSRVFERAQQAARTIDDEQFQTPEQPQDMTDGIWGESTVGDAVMEHLTHASRHLGMMECLLGLQGQRGTATQ
jgi:hypothetical protein